MLTTSAAPRWEVPPAEPSPETEAIQAPAVGPRAAQRRWRPVPTGRAALLVVVAAVAVLAVPLPGGWGLLVTAGAAALVAAIDLALAADPRRVEVRRRLPAVVQLGSSAEVTWSIRNPGRQAAHLAIADELAPSLRAATRRVHVVAGPGRTHHLTTTIRPGRRGRFVLGELAVRATGPLGLMARQASRTEPQELKVYPPFGPRQQAQVTHRIRLAGMGERRDRVAGGGTDFDQLREYSVDDDARRIDWAATARSSRPIVRTYRVERNQTVMVLEDNGRIMAGRVAGVPRAEHAMDAALMLTAAATRLGDRLGLTTFDDELRTSVAPQSGASQLGRVSEALYQLEPQLLESDYRAAFAHAIARVRRHSLVCLLTELADESLVETLLPAVPLLTRTHLVLVGSVRDPQVAAWARGAPADAEEAYRQAAALQHLEARQRLAGRLRSLGAVVVDRDPGDLAPALTDAYLRAKLTGAL